MQEVPKALFAITLTKTEALRIQAEQVDYYVAMYGDEVRTIVAGATHADRLDDHLAYDVVDVNRCIPRGGKIEHLIRHLSPHTREQAPTAS